jgi:pimeloyl-ACP methyl ester carboxylesterase
MTDDLESGGLSATLGAHELVLLHGQPGSAADWVQIAERLPPQLHAVAADRPGYGSSELPAAGFAANARAVLDGSPTHRTTRCPPIPGAGWRRPCRTLACNSSRGPVITCPDTPQVPSPMRS